jgi:hypothetical protein
LRPPCSRCHRHGSRRAAIGERPHITEDQARTSAIRGRQLEESDDGCRRFTKAAVGVPPRERPAKIGELRGIPGKFIGRILGLMPHPQASLQVPRGAPTT